MTQIDSRLVMIEKARFQCPKCENIFTLNRYEPRIRLESVDVQQLNDINTLDSNDLNVTIRYYIIGKDLPIQELNVVLVPTR